MENKYLLELSIERGLNDNQLSKIADVLYQMGIEKIGDDRSRKFVDYILEHDMVEMPIEEILDHFSSANKPKAADAGENAGEPEQAQN